VPFSFRGPTEILLAAQILWVWTVSLPVVVLNSPAVSDPALGGSNPAFGTARDVVGIVLWALGFAIETVTDAQKARRLVSLLALQWW
jgi:steroid 5-alpha reductase family enzyme